MQKNLLGTINKQQTNVVYSVILRLTNHLINTVYLSNCCAYGHTLVLPLRSLSSLFYSNSAKDFALNALSENIELKVHFGAIFTLLHSNRHSRKQTNVYRM